MKLIVTLTLMWTVYSTAEALQCSRCFGSCTSPETVNCTNGEVMCGTVTFSVNLSLVVNLATSVSIRGCASAFLCPRAGPQNFSLNLAAVAGQGSAECCSTDNCNNVTLPVPTAPVNTTNSLRCVSCNPLTSRCGSTVNCVGEEDRCVKTRVTVQGLGVSLPFYGCTSENLCISASILNSFQLVNNSNVVSGPTCCTGNLCNAGSTTTSRFCCFTLSLMYLLLGLFMFYIF